MTTVKIPVAIHTGILIRIANVVAREDAYKFTILLPINIALSILPYFSNTSRAVCALLLPSSARALSLTLFTVVSDVSAEEKNADNITKINNANNCMTPSVSNSKSLLIFYFCFKHA